MGSFISYNQTVKKYSFIILLTTSEQYFLIIDMSRRIQLTYLFILLIMPYCHARLRQVLRIGYSGSTLRWVQCLPLNSYKKRNLQKLSTKNTTKLENSSNSSGFLIRGRLKMERMSHKGPKTSKKTLFFETYEIGEIIFKHFSFQTIMYQKDGPVYYHKMI